MYQNTFYTRLIRITLITHVLPRLLAHVLAITFLSSLIITSLENKRWIASSPTITKSYQCTLLNIPHCWYKGHSNPQVTDASQKSILTSHSLRTTIVKLTPSLEAEIKPYSPSRTLYSDNIYIIALACVIFSRSVNPEPTSNTLF